MWHCKFSSSIAACHPILPAGSCGPPAIQTVRAQQLEPWEIHNSLWESPWNSCNVGSMLHSPPSIFREKPWLRAISQLRQAMGPQQVAPVPLGSQHPRHLNYGSLCAPQEAKRLRQPLEKLIFWMHDPFFSFLSSEKQRAKTRCSPDVAVETVPWTRSNWPPKLIGKVLCLLQRPSPTGRRNHLVQCASPLTGIFWEKKKLYYLHH